MRGHARVPKTQFRLGLGLIRWSSLTLTRNTQVDHSALNIGYLITACVAYRDGFTNIFYIRSDSFMEIAFKILLILCTNVASINTGFVLFHLLILTRPNYMQCAG